MHEDEAGDLDEGKDDAEQRGKGPEADDGGQGGETGHDALRGGVLPHAEVAGEVTAVVGLDEEAKLDDAEEGGEDEPVGRQEGADEEDEVDVAVAGQVRGEAVVEDRLGGGRVEVLWVDEVRHRGVGEGSQFKG